MNLDGVDVASVTGTFYRHSDLKTQDLVGSVASTGRWGSSKHHRVLYLGRPKDAVIREAYKRLVDSVPGMEPSMVAARMFLHCGVDIDNVVDLRTEHSLEVLDISGDVLVGDPGPCQVVGDLAFENGYKGVIAPSAAGPGETIAVFMENLTESEVPKKIEAHMWDKLPPRP